jgi:AcrR family transcriptional regulator
VSKLRTKSTRVKRLSSSPFKTRDQKASDHEDKRLAVLTTAAELFVTQGFHSTKLTDVADRLNITKPAIYYYFASKDEILIACTRTALDLTKTYFAESDDIKLNGRERLERFMIWYGESMTVPFGQCLVRVAEHDVEAETQKQLVAAKRVIYQRLLQLVEAGIEDRSIGKCEASVAAFTIAGALSWLSHWHRPGGKLSAHEAAKHVTALLLNGLAAGSNSTDDR